MVRIPWPRNISLQQGTAGLCYTTVLYYLLRQIGNHKFPSSLWLGYSEVDNHTLLLLKVAFGGDSQLNFESGYLFLDSVVNFKSMKLSSYREREQGLRTVELNTSVFILMVNGNDWLLMANVTLDILVNEFSISCLCRLSCIQMVALFSVVKPWN